MLNRGKPSVVLCLAFFLSSAAEVQPIISGSAPEETKAENPPDALGRTTPRGAVLGFLRAARKGDYEAASQYMDTRLKGKAAADLAHQLFVVLDRRLPARLNELSDRPEGSLPFLTKPDLDLIGTISSSTNGQVDILVERVASQKNGPVWLFSRQTLDLIPDVFDEVKAVSVEDALPTFLVRTRLAGVALFEWLAVFLGLPLLYLATGLLSRAVSPWVGRMRRHLRNNASLPNPVLPNPVRLLLLALIVRWGLTKIALPLLARQFWTGTAAMIAVAGCVWLMVLLNGRGEYYLRRRLERMNNTGATSVLRLGRRMIDLLIIFIGMLVGLQYFGVKATAALAGLGVGGIAVALAAQKTLENVIGGISLIFDKAVRPGDQLSTGATNGVVEYIGLRSTRIRTFERTVVSVPNGQLANVQLENFSARDKFWFHHNVSLRYETTATMMRSIVDGISSMLQRHNLVEGGSARVQFLRFGASSFDVEIFAYIVARDWDQFLQIQQELLLQVMEIVEAAGTRMALPSQTTYLVSDPASNGGGSIGRLRVDPNGNTRPDTPAAS